jgi:Txe/YoeB family toxin of Txe-Axe toxin-antitoxin module
MIRLIQRIVAAFTKTQEEQQMVKVLRNDDTLLAAITVVRSTPLAGCVDYVELRKFPTGVVCRRWSQHHRVVGQIKNTSVPLAAFERAMGVLADPVFRQLAGGSRAVKDGQTYLAVWGTRNFINRARVRSPADPSAVSVLDDLLNIGNG